MPKSIGQRTVDGARNLWRHGHIRNPHFNVPALTESLAPIAEEIRAARTRDAVRTSALLDRYEADFLAAGHRKFLVFSHYHAGNLQRAALLGRSLDPGRLSPHERQVAANIAFEHHAYDLLRAGRAPLDLAPRKTSKGSSPPRALYIAASSLPYIVSGYTSRSEAIVRTLGEDADVEIVPVTRPGFPGDRSDAQIPRSRTRMNMRFENLPSAVDYRDDFNSYLDAALPVLLERARQHDINIVHGVSNYRNGAIGLATARRLGLPFVYEIRGLWEETSDSKRVGWRDTERFDYERRFEKFLYREADGVLAINNQVREILEDEPRENVAILPNCVAGAQIRHRRNRAPSNDCLRLGYIGSLLEYEGLDDVLRALSTLYADGLDFRFDIYGKGNFGDSLRALATDLGLGRKVEFHGLVPPTEVAALYDRFDLCVFARKPYRVCELVTPLKPLEAMANDVNCILSDVPPQAEIASNGGALLFEAGDQRSLADAIETFHRMDDRARATIREHARMDIEKRFTWETQRAVVSDVYRKALA